MLTFLVLSILLFLVGKALIGMTLTAAGGVIAVLVLLLTFIIKKRKG